MNLSKYQGRIPDPVRWGRHQDAQELERELIIGEFFDLIGRAGQ